MAGGRALAPQAVEETSALTPNARGPTWWGLQQMLLPQGSAPPRRRRGMSLLRSCGSVVVCAPAARCSVRLGVTAVRCCGCARGRALSGCCHDNCQSNCYQGTVRVLQEQLPE